MGSSVRIARAARTDATRDEVQGKRTMQTIARFIGDESGVTSVKYGLIAACISLAIVTVLQGVGTRLSASAE